MVSVTSTVLRSLSSKCRELEGLEATRTASFDKGCYMEEASTCTLSTIYSKSSDDDAPISMSSCSTNGTEKHVENRTAPAEWISLGNQRYKNGDVEFAETCYIKAIESFTMLEYSEHDILLQLECLADAYYNLAAVKWTHDSVSPDAVDLLLRSLRVHEEYHILVRYALDTPSAALNYDNMAHRREPLAMAAVLTQLGFGCIGMDLYADAQDALMSAYELRLDALGHIPHKLLAKSLDALGALAMQQKDYQAAIAYFETSFSVHRCLDEKSCITYNLAMTLRNIALAYEVGGDLAPAMFRYQLVVGMLQELLLTSSDDDDGNARLRKRIGQTLKAIGDLLYQSNCYQEAAESYQTAQYFLLAAVMGFNQMQKD